MRRHSPVETNLCLRRHRFAVSLGQDRPTGAFRKSHPLDCGNPRCGLCHGDKVWGEPRRDERRGRLALSEGRAEVFGM